MNDATSDPKEIFLDALECQSSEELTRFLDETCAGDSTVRGRVELLLRAHKLAGRFLDGSGPDDAISEGAGSVLGVYTLVEQIGEGGMGVVFKAKQSEPVERLVAIKIIRPGMDSRQVIARFATERQALAVMDHANIARVLDAGTTDTGRPYFVMDLVGGIPITDYCDRRKLPVRERLVLMAAVCQAIQHAHQKGVIHRDIKPKNVLVAESDGKAIPKIIDFGVAKAIAQSPLDKTTFTKIGQIIGTFEYMSPEQARFNDVDVDTRTDIYSLGVLLYELLTGSTPLEKQRLETAALDETLQIIRTEDPPTPSTRVQACRALATIADRRQIEPSRLSGLIRGDLDWIVMKALEKDRNRRYETANGLARDIERYLADEPVQAGPPTARYRFRKFARRNKVVLVTTAIVTVSLLLATIISVWQATVAQRARALAETRLQNETEARQQASVVSDTLLQMLQTADPFGAKNADYTVRQMLDDFSARFGDEFKDQPATAAAIHAIIGARYQQLGMADKAESHLMAALDLRRQAFGADHVLVAHSLVDYAWFLWASGEKAEADKLAREALAMQQRLGARDPVIMLANLHLLQNVAADRRRYDESEQFAQQALEIAHGQLKPLSGEASILRTSADTAILRGDLAKAEPLARKALALHRKLQGDDHLVTGAGWNALANVLYHQKKFDEAEPCYRHAATIYVKRAGYCPMAVLTPLATILDAKCDQVGLNELRPLADAEEEKNGPYGWQKASTRGVLRARLSEWEKAEAHFAKVVELAPDSVTETCAKADYSLALLRLRANDRSGYRAACIAGVNRQQAKQKPAYFYVVCASVVAPDAGVDPGQLVKLAESSAARSPEDPNYLTICGAALYRAGRWKEAHITLTKAIHAYDSLHATTRATDVRAHAQLFLAMANHHLGRSEHAHESFNTAIKTLEKDGSASQSDYAGMSWDSRLTAQLLRQEAEQLLKDDGANAPATGRP